MAGKDEDLGNIPSLDALVLDLARVLLPELESADDAVKAAEEIKQERILAALKDDKFNVEFYTSVDDLIKECNVSRFATRNFLVVADLLRQGQRGAVVVRDDVMGMYEGMKRDTQFNEKAYCVFVGNPDTMTNKRDQKKVADLVQSDGHFMVAGDYDLIHETLVDSHVCVALGGNGEVEPAKEVMIDYTTDEPEGASEAIPEPIDVDDDDNAKTGVFHVPSTPLERVAEVGVAKKDSAPPISIDSTVEPRKDEKTTPFKVSDAEPEYVSQMFVCGVAEKDRDFILQMGIKMEGVEGALIHYTDKDIGELLTSDDFRNYFNEAALDDAIGGYHGILLLAHAKDKSNGMTHVSNIKDTLKFMKMVIRPDGDIAVCYDFVSNNKMEAFLSEQKIDGFPVMGGLKDGDALDQALKATGYLIDKARKRAREANAIGKKLAKTQIRLFETITDLYDQPSLDAEEQAVLDRIGEAEDEVAGSVIVPLPIPKPDSESVDGIPDLLDDEVPTGVLPVPSEPEPVPSRPPLPPMPPRPAPSRSAAVSGPPKGISVFEALPHTDFRNEQLYGTMYHSVEQDLFGVEGVTNALKENYTKLGILYIQPEEARLRKVFLDVLKERGLTEEQLDFLGEHLKVLHEKSEDLPSIDQAVALVGDVLPNMMKKDPDGYQQIHELTKIALAGYRQGGADLLTESFLLWNSFEDDNYHFEVARILTGLAKSGEEDISAKTLEAVRKGDDFDDDTREAYLKTVIERCEQDGSWSKFEEAVEFAHAKYVQIKRMRERPEPEAVPEPEPVAQPEPAASEPEPVAPEPAYVAPAPVDGPKPEDSYVHDGHDDGKEGGEEKPIEKITDDSDDVEEAKMPEEEKPKTGPETPAPVAKPEPEPIPAPAPEPAKVEPVPAPAVDKDKKKEYSLLDTVDDPKKPAAPKPAAAGGEGRGGRNWMGYVAAAAGVAVLAVGGYMLLRSDGCDRGSPSGLEAIADERADSVRDQYKNIPADVASTLAGRYNIKTLRPEDPDEAGYRRHMELYGKAVSLGLDVNEDTSVTDLDKMVSDAESARARERDTFFRLMDEYNAERGLGPFGCCTDGCDYEAPECVGAPDAGVPAQVVVAQPDAAPQPVQAQTPAAPPQAPPGYQQHGPAHPPAHAQPPVQQRFGTYTPATKMGSKVSGVSYGHGHRGAQ